jgi:hypothetical protein
VLYQAWAFVAPGLYSHEKKLVMPLVISSTLLFFIGVAFCYFFVFGQVFKFIQSFAPKSITAAPDIEAYLSFVLTMFIAFGLAFEVPIVVIVLARMGMADVVKMQVFLVHDARAPMDFKAFMEGYTQFFGGAQPNLPARSVVGIASLANPGFLVEIEVVAAKDSK